VIILRFPEEWGKWKGKKEKEEGEKGNERKREDNSTLLSSFFFRFFP
jgi:hypothetical protein